MIEWLNFATAVFSFLAAAAAATAAWLVPRTAAKFAETMRREGEAASEKKRMKLYVFAQLMQERARIYSEDSVKALNLVDVVFNDSEAVRGSWAELYLTFQRKPMPDHIVDEKLRVLLAAMAQDIGLADKLRVDDLGRVYFPTAVAQDRIIKDLQRQKLWDALQAETSPAADVQAIESPFPPSPSRDK